jgi:hypothetical protein
VFEPTFGAEDLVSLPNRHIYLRLMIEGEVGRGFSATTFPGRETVSLEVDNKLDCWYHQ